MSVRRYSVAVVLAACCGSLAPGQGQPSAEKTKQRAEAGERADALTREGKFAEAVEPAALCLRLSGETDGEKHWRTFDAAHRLKLAEAAKGFGAEKQQKLREALAAEGRANALEADKPAEALKQAQAALDGYREVLGAESVEAARLWHLIGRVRSAQKDTKGALDANKQALAIRRKALPERHPDLGRSLNNLGLALQKSKDLKGARKALEEAVTIWKESLGRNDALTAMGLNNLAGVQEDLEDYAAAGKSYKDVLAIRRATLPGDDQRIADVLEKLATVQWLHEEFSDAKKSYEEALAIRRKDPNPDEEGIAFLLEGLGLTHMDLDDNAAAKKCFEEALALRRKPPKPDQELVATNLYTLGRIEKKLKDFKGAQKRFEDAVAIRRKLQPPDDKGLADALRNLADVHNKLQDFDTARKYAGEALTVYRKATPPDRNGVLFSLWILGKAQKGLEDFVAARKTCEEALAVSRKGPNRDEMEVALSQVALAAVLFELREYEAARKYFDEALPVIRKDMSATELLATALNDLGALQNALQEFAAARKTIEESLAIQRKAERVDPAPLALTLMNLGNTQYMLREYAAARTNLGEALALMRKADRPNNKAVAVALGNLGRVQTELGDFAGARKNLDEGLTLARKTFAANDARIGTVLGNLGGLAHLQKDFTQARNHLAESVAIFRKALPADHPDLAAALVWLAQTQFPLQDFRGARKNLEEALGIYRKALPPDDPRLADVYANLGIALASEQNLWDYLSARKNIEQSLGIRRKVLPPDHPDIGRSLLLAGLVNYGEGEFKAGVLRLQEAVDVFLGDQLRRTVAQSEQEQFNTTAFPHLALDLLLTGATAAGTDPAPIYDRLVRVKGFVTTQQGWARQLRNSSDPETARLLARLREVSRQLVTLSAAQGTESATSASRDVVASIKSLSAERNELERTISQRSPAFRDIQSRARVGTEDIRAALPPDAALVDIVEYTHLVLPTEGRKEGTLENRLVAFVVRSDRRGVQVVALGPSSAMAGLVDGWRSTYGSGKRPARGEADPGKQLREKVWEPLEPHLRGAKVVLLSPDGPLHGLPLAALPGAKDGSYLAEEYAFAVVPVPQMLPGLLGGKPGTAATALVVGDVDFGTPSGAAGGRFQQLPGTEVEAREVAELFRAAVPQGKVTTLFGRDATKKAFVEAAAAHSHLLVATHGFYVPDPDPGKADRPAETRSVRSVFLNPEAAATNPAVRCGLVFAGVNRSARDQGDAFLTALEVSELDLRHATLVVLSACETGLGRVQQGDAVIGLQRAFQVAGARTVVASLWPVRDEATRALMGQFYRNLWEKKLPRAEALRQAQLWFLKEARAKPGLVRSGLMPEDDGGWKPGDPVPPHFWAAFVLAGDWR